jgi:hypothetical protein
MADNSFIFSDGTEADEPVRVRFGDGERAVPGWIVHHYGGKKKLLEDADVFAEVTYRDFISSFDEAVARERLNQIGFQFVSRHLALRKR